MDNRKKTESPPNQTTPGQATTTWEGRKLILQIIAIILSATAILITLVMNKNQERNEQPNLAARVKVAFSPNYTNLLDQQYLAQVGMTRKNVGYAFFNQELDEYLHPDYQGQNRYLFIQLMNEGPGIAGQVRIDGITWEPKAGKNPPAGLPEVIGVDFGLLQANQMLTLLIDAAPNLSPTNLLSAANAEEICIEYSYTGYLDDAAWIKGKPLCVSSASPAELEPMFPIKE